MKIKLIYAIIYVNSLITKMFKKIIIFFFLLLNFQYTAFAQLSLKAEENKFFTLKPGEKLETYITLRNSYNKKTSVNIYTADGGKTTSGTFSAKLLDREQLFFGKWASFEQNFVELEPHATNRYKLTIDIPPTATPGDYSGGVAASRIIVDENADSSGLDNRNVGASIGFTTRIIIPIYFSVEGARKAELNIGQLEARKHLNSTEYTAYLNLVNNGNTAIRTEILPEMNSLFGETKKTFAKQELLLMPQENVDLPIPLGVLDYFNKYNLNVSIDYFEVNLLNNTESLSETVSRSIEFWLIPWQQIILITIVVLAVIIFFIYQKTHISHIIKKSSKYKVKSGDTINNLAIKQNINWKTIVKINKLKAPYELTAGQDILLPQKKNQQ